MGLINAMLGNSSEVPPERLQTDFATLLVPGERVLRGYQLIRDTFVFTDRRLILADKQGITGKKVEYQSIPYRSVVHFSVETAGTFDLDAELRIWLMGSPQPVSRNFTKQVSVYAVQAMLAAMVCEARPAGFVPPPPPA